MSTTAPEQSCGTERRTPFRRVGVGTPQSDRAETEFGAPVPQERGAVVHRRLLLLGLGNDIMTDDAVGLCIAREVQRRLTDHDHIEVAETSEMGLSLLDHVVGFTDLILVDAVQTRQALPGHLHEIDLEHLPVLPAISPHFLGVGEVLSLGRELGLPVPERVKILAIEVQDPFTVGTQMTPALQRALPALVERVTATVLRFGEAPARKVEVAAG